MWKQRNIDELILHIRRLVRARERLREAGASPRELDLQSAEISRLQSRLADQVRRALGEQNAG